MLMGYLCSITALILIVVIPEEKSLLVIVIRGCFVKQVGFHDNLLHVGVNRPLNICMNLTSF